MELLSATSIQSIVMPLLFYYRKQNSYLLNDFKPNNALIQQLPVVRWFKWSVRYPISLVYMPLLLIHTTYHGIMTARELAIQLGRKA